MDKRTKQIAGGTAGAIAIAFATYLATGRVDCTPEQLAKLQDAAKQAIVEQDADDYAATERKLQTLVKVCEEAKLPLPTIPQEPKR